MAAVKPFVLTRLIRGSRQEPDGVGEELQGPRAVLQGSWWWVRKGRGRAVVAHVKLRSWFIVMVLFCSS